MTRESFVYLSVSADRIFKWANSFLDNGFLDVKHGPVFHYAVYSVDVEEATNIIIP